MMSIMKTILILGNGYDLAHGMKTSYNDFLDYCEKTMDLSKNGLINACDYPSVRMQLLDSIRDNVWYDYFTKITELIPGNKWIDFESEMEYIIKLIDNSFSSLSENYSSWSDKIYANHQISNDDRGKEFLSISKKHEDEYATMRGYRDYLYSDCKRMVNALHTYLCHIEKTTEYGKELSDLEVYNPDYVITFNYTHTYQELHIRDHDNEKGNWIQYIHGQCNIDLENSINAGADNLVLGIDDYMDSEDKNNSTNFVIFDKYVQRVRKRTGLEYVWWIEQIEEEYQDSLSKKEQKVYYPSAKVIIYGHSLGLSDREVLAPYLKSPATEVTIFCYDEASEGDIIENLIKMIGKKQLMEKVNNIPPLIIFKKTTC